MTVVADVGIDVEVVEEHETLCQPVGVGGHVAPEQRQRRIAVALREIAEHLVVGAVLSDDVEHVLDRRCAADGTRESASRTECSDSSDGWHPYRA
jgi:ribosomal protein S16